MAEFEKRLDQMTPLQRAVFALKETQQRLESLERQRNEPIALVGMSCRFPGGANDPRSFWQLLRDGVDAVGEIPADRWDIDAYYDADAAAPGKMNTRWGGFLKNIADFDNHFFSISDREATRIDPQHRLTMELVWEALEDAGIPPQSLRGSRTGVFIGLSHSEYGIMLSTDMAQCDAYVSTGTAHCLAANRVSYVYDFQGPSVTLDTACSSSLVAVHLACQSLRCGESQVALAGGVNIILSPLATVNLTKAGFSAPDGRVCAFDAAASGYVRSEGAGIVVLKPLSAAVRDRDPIYAVIRGSATNQNGFGNGLTAPNRTAQDRVLREAYAAARIAPSDVQYVETQGTGTRLGDAIEALSLGELMREGRAEGERCAIGSVKTNLGHLEAASGVASLMKVALAMQNKELPATLHFKSPNPDIPFANLPIRVQSQHGEWPAAKSQRIAGVSAFGFGGSNAHLVVAEAPAEALASDTTVRSKSGNDHAWLLLSARTETALKALAQSYIPYLQNSNAGNWQDICYTAAARRDHHDCRLALRASSAVDATRLLEQFVSGVSSPGVLTGRKPYGRDVKLGFVYGPANGPEDALVYRAAASLPGWSEAVAEIDAALVATVGWSLTDAAANGATWSDPSRVYAASVGLQLALTAWWQRVGVTPGAVVGAGSGELAAAVVAGIVTRDDALRLAAAFDQNTAMTNGQPLASSPANLPFISAADGQVRNELGTTVSDWKQRMRHALDWQAACLSLRERQVDHAIAIGASAVNEPVRSIVNEYVPMIGGKNTGELTGDSVRATAGALYCAGTAVRWGRWLSHGRFVHIPSYPWQRHRLWADRENWLENAHGTGTKKPSAENGLGQKLSPSHDNAITEGEVPSKNEPRRIRPELNTPYEAPRTPLEAELVISWAEILKIDRVGVHDNFFELGGDSLQAMILHNSLQDRLGEVVLGYVLFQAQTVDGLAAYMRSHYPTAVQRLYPEEKCEAATDVTSVPTSVGPTELEYVKRLVAHLAPIAPFPPPTSPRNHRAVFVLSPPRSGSTLLRVMLAGNSRLFSPPELELLSFGTMAARKQAYAGVPGQWLEGVIRMVMEVRHCDVDEARRIVGQFEDEGTSVQEFYGWVQNSLGDRLLVDKTPSYSGRIEYLRRAEELFEDPLYIHLLRHPCGMVRSYVDYQMHEAFKMRFAFGTETPFTPQQMAELTWIISHQNIQEFLADVPASRQYRLRFEDVVGEPEQAMRGVCRFLDLDYQDGMIHPYDKSEQKMLDGVVAQDRMYGDQKFLVKHKSIDPRAADEWRAHLNPDFLGSVSRALAEEFKYDDVASIAAQNNDSRQGDLVTAAQGKLRLAGELAASLNSHDSATQLLNNLDQLSDAEIGSLLQEHLADEARNE